MNHVCKWWYDERFLARPWGTSCTCGWQGCFPDQMEAEEAIEHHKQRWAEAEAKLRRSNATSEVGYTERKETAATEYRKVNEI